jgi:hypothetical protein
MVAMAYQDFLGGALSRSTWHERNVWSTDQRLDQQPIPAWRLRRVTTFDGPHVVFQPSHNGMTKESFTSSVL